MNTEEYCISTWCHPDKMREARAPCEVASVKMPGHSRYFAKGPDRGQYLFEAFGQMNGASVQKSAEKPPAKKHLSHAQGQERSGAPISNRHEFSDRDIAPNRSSAFRSEMHWGEGARRQCACYSPFVL